MKELTSVATKDNWKTLFEKTENMSVQDTIDLVGTMRHKKLPAATASVPQEPLTKLTFCVFPAQAENIQAALKVAEYEASSSSQGHLLDCICTEYLAGKADTGDAVTDAASRLARIIENIQRAFGVKLSVKS